MTAAYRGGVVLAEVVRSGFVEGRHVGSVVGLDGAGDVVFARGDAAGPVFPRSSNKPMQAAGMLRSGLVLESLPELALASASHYGEPNHVSIVELMLARGGFVEGDLRCPPDLPLSERARDEVLRAGGGPSRLLMNCSGKHAAMLLTCRANDWSTVDYVDPDHPLQRACAAAVAELTGEPIAATGVDGCGAPVLAVSLTGLARAFLSLVCAADGTPERAVADALRAHPVLMSGPGADDARLMAAVPGLLCKVGAEGVWAAAVPGVGAVALKIDDGAARARLPVMMSALTDLGVAGAATLGGVPILGGGEAVGEVRVVAA